MDCREARPLVPGYLDGELSEAQAAPLRRHLLDCPGCRAVTQADKALKSWFVDEGPVEIPAGFAARVARRALAGDTGERWGAQLETAEDRGLHGFVLQLTALAAALVISLSIGFRTMSLPRTDDLRADDFSLESALETLDEMNREPVSQPPAPKLDDVGEDSEARCTDEEGRRE